MGALRSILAVAVAAALAGCALKSPPRARRAGERGRGESAGPGEVDRAGGCTGRRRGRLARVVQRYAARRARAGGACLQPRSAGRGRARRAGRGIPEGRRRAALPAGQPPRPRRRKDERRLERAGGRRRVRELGARSLGARARRAQPRPDPSTSRPHSTTSTPANRSPRRSRKAGSSPPRRACRRRSPTRRCVHRMRLVGLAQDRLRVGVGRRVRRPARPGEPADLPRRRAEPRSRPPAGAALARDAGGTLPCGGGRGAARARACPRAGPGRDALRAPRAPAGRGRGGAARRRGVLPHRGGEERRACRGSRWLRR